jgi:hypothetical protein
MNHISTDSTSHPGLKNIHQKLKSGEFQLQSQTFFVSHISEDGPPKFLTAAFFASFFFLHNFPSESELTTTRVTECLVKKRQMPPKVAQPIFCQI